MSIDTATYTECDKELRQKNHAHPYIDKLQNVKAKGTFSQESITKSNSSLGASLILNLSNKLMNTYSSVDMLTCIKI